MLLSLKWWFTGNTAFHAKGRLKNLSDGLFLCFSIRDYIYARITFFTEQVLSQNLTLVLTVIIGLLTVWVMIQGFLIVTGRSQEGIKGFVFNLGKTYFIVAMALGVAAGGKFGVRTLTDTLSDGISQIMTGNSDVGSKCLTQDAQVIIGCKIDMNLTATQSMMGMLDGIDTADSDYLENKISEARWFAGIGTAGPAIVAGTMLIMFRIAIALFIGFAPIFILCLLFKKTAPLFQKWLNYGLATIFSSVMLGVMADIAMDLVSNIAITDAVTRIASILGGGNLSGIMQTVTQQLGLGLVLSTLLIVVPPMAGAWFSGLMASYYGSNYIGNWNSTGQQSSVQGSGAGSGAHQQIEHRANQVTERLAQGHGSTQPVTATQQWINTTGSTTTSTDPNAIKTPLQTQYGLASGPKTPLPTPQPKPDPKQQTDDSI